MSENIVDLICEKYKKKVKSDKAVCEHLEEYCKFRGACIINLMTRESLREMRQTAEAEKEGDCSCAADQEKMDKLNFSKGDGLLPAIVQDYQTGEVLMLAYINEESWLKTLETGKAHYWSRSRNQLWLKGESSGHVQIIKAILVDCDEDTVVFKVEQKGGAACHKGYASCFFRVVENGSFQIKGQPVFDPKEVYKK